MIYRRGAIDLSMNMIVMIIISLAILAGGIVFINKLINDATEIKAQIDQNTEERLSDLLVEQGQQVAFPFHTKDIARGEHHVFGIGILNTGDVGNQFKIMIEFDRIKDASGMDVQLTINPAEWARYNREELIILEGESAKEGILIQVPNDAPSGQYFFKALVLLPSGETYGLPQRFDVKVK